MNVTISILRIAILFVLGFISFILVLGEPIEGTSLLSIIALKSAGVVTLFTTARLYTLWAKEDAWLKAIDSLCTYNEKND